MTYGQRPARTTIRHGMPSCARYGCDKPECRRAYRISHARSQMDRARGITGHVDPRAAGLHIRKLQRAGMSLGDIAARSGISRSRIGKIAEGAPKRIMRTTQDAILGIPLPRVGTTPHRPGFIDATGARRRLQALAALGFTRAEVSRRVGVSARTLGDVRRGDQGRILIAHNQAITRVYEQLWNQRPEDHGTAPNTASRLRAYAARQGWKRPADLDDDLIDIPDVAA